MSLANKLLCRVTGSESKSTQEMSSKSKPEEVVTKFVAVSGCLIGTNLLAYLDTVHRRTLGRITLLIARGMRCNQSCVARETS